MPFVPVLDGEVRRWYMADGLWQAQDDRLGADEVFVIPGPEAVAGITRADEPVAELLARFEAEAIARVRRRRSRARLAAPGPAPEPLAASPAATARSRRSAPRSASSASDGRTRPNPLWRLIAPGDTITEHDGTRHRPPVRRATIETRHARAPTATTRVVTVDTATGDPLVLRFRPLRSRVPRVAGDAASRRTRRRVELGGDAARAAFAAARARRPSAPRRRRRPVRAALRTPWTCPAELPRAYRAATGAAHDGVPLDLALTLAWPALTALLAYPELAARLPELVHASHAVRPGRGVAAACRARRARRRRGSSSSPTPPTRRPGCAATPG